MTSGPATGNSRAARRTALEALSRIEQGAYANLVLGGFLDRSSLDQRDRRFVTELVYGVTRMRRALDAQLGPLLRHDLDPQTRDVLRLGAFQLLYLRVPPHAAVSSSVEVAPLRTKKLVNAVLRKLSVSGLRPWDTEADRLSYPEWTITRLVEDLGFERAMAALEFMNEAPVVTERDDGYVQDRASQWVAEAVDADRSMTVLDMCAAPGGKATALAATGARVVAADVRPNRSRLTAHNIAELGVGAQTAVALTADGRHPPFAAEAFDRVLLDAPCSGLGVLHRRPDARWRTDRADLTGLVQLQRDLLGAALNLVCPGGVLVYSVCTLTIAESVDHDRWMKDTHPDWAALPGLDDPWVPLGRGSLLLPQAARTDGMCLFRWCRPGP